MNDLHVDVMGLAETQTPWKTPELRCKYHNWGRREFGLMKSAYDMQLIQPRTMLHSKQEERLPQLSESGRQKYWENPFRTLREWADTAALSFWEKDTRN